MYNKKMFGHNYTYMLTLTIYNNKCCSWFFHATCTYNYVGLVSLSSVVCSVKTRSRFKCIDKMKEREMLFQERVSELKKVNRQREEDQRQAARSRGEKVCVPLRIIIVHVSFAIKVKY